MNITIDSYKNCYTYKVHSSFSALNESLHHYAIDLYVVDAACYSLFKDNLSCVSSKLACIDVTSSTKDFSSLSHLLNLFVQYGLHSKSTVCVIGGATLQDLVATSCGLYQRGIDWIFVPTTLLAQGDSAIGSKTSIDFNGIKNKLGLFYPPSSIHVCKEFLFTLPYLELLSGVGDILHYILPYRQGIISMEQVISSLSSTSNLLAMTDELIAVSMKIKSELVGIDEFDQGPRKIFNFGHTFGHALEKSSSCYLPHGLAVLCGMYLSLIFAAESNFYVSKEIYSQASSLETIVSHFSNKLPLDMSFSYKSFEASLLKDKKNFSLGKFTAIFPCSLADSIWSSSSFTPVYGLRLMNIDIQESRKILSLLSKFNFKLIP